MTRRESREHILRLLFLREFHEKEEIEEQNSLYFDEFNFKSDEDSESVVSESNREMILEKYGKIVLKLGELDSIISKAAEGWKLDRMGKVELNILRLATYEIRFDESVPGKVAVNEAVDLAKIYSGGAAPKFINGILAKVI